MRTENGYLIAAYAEANLTSSSGGGTAIQLCPPGNILALATLVANGAYITATTATPHGYFSGQNVQILNTGDAAFNGYFSITVTSPTAFFYYAATAPAVASANATSSTFKVRTALIQADAGNTAAVTLGPDSNATARSLAAGQEYVIPQLVNVDGFAAKFDLATWYFKSASASQVLRVLWICLMGMIFFLASDAHAQQGGGGYQGIQQIIPGSGVTVTPSGSAPVITISATGSGTNSGGIATLNGFGTNTTINALTNIGNFTLVSNATYGLGNINFPADAKFSFRDLSNVEQGYLSFFPQHSVEAHTGFTINGAFGIDIGQDDQGKANYELTPGAYHVQWEWGYDDVDFNLGNGSTNLLGNSMPQVTRFRVAASTNSGAIEHDAAWWLSATSTNGAFKNEFHDVWNPTSIYNNQPTKDPGTDHVAGGFTSTLFYWGAVAITNSLHIGTSNLVNYGVSNALQVDGPTFINSATGVDFEVTDPTDPGETRGIIDVSGASPNSGGVVSLGRLSTSSGHSSAVVIRERDNTVMARFDGPQNWVWFGPLNVGFGNQQNPQFAVDALGTGNFSTSVLSPQGNLNNATVTNSLTVSNVIGGVVETPNTTSTATFNTAGKTETIYNTSGSTITTLTIALPSTSSSGETLRYVTAGVVTTVTVTGTVAIGAAVTTLAANASIAYQAVNTTGTFIRIQ